MNTYTKLKNGEWGVRVTDAASPGQTVVVVTKAGKTKEEVVERVLWTGDGIAVCSLKRKESKKDYPGKMCPVCGSEPLDENLSCWECGYAGEE